VGQRYQFDEFELDTRTYQLHGHGEPIHLEPRALDLLHYLLRHRDRVVGKDELLDAVWGDHFVSDAALTTALRTARRAVRDDGSQQRILRTVHRRGYQFVAEVSLEAAGKRESLSGPTGEQSIRFCHPGDGTRIAWATLGSGSPLLKAANWMTHLVLERTSPVWAHWLDGLAGNHRLIRYDERGCGMSDWEVPAFDFDAWVDDLETVVEASGLDRFPLLGVSQGGAVAIAYAVRHPDRISHLVLAGAYARGRAVRASSDAELAEAALDLDLARVGWQRQDTSFLQVFASQFLPDGTPEQWADFVQFQRQTTSPDNAVRFLEAFADIDVSALAPQVSCPTLVLHSRDDVRVPADQAVELATLIPDSQLAMLDSPNHLLSATEPAWNEFLGRIDAFLSI
jgi:DNA-binding winged helix-turn-helix (wHTH) protein/alpha-beta hydrolase superfamily lysophospholipase